MISLTLLANRLLKISKNKKTDKEILPIFAELAVWEYQKHFKCLLKQF